jgi:pimeloyl-ACP methyl ester carboxylesterase
VDGYASIEGRKLYYEIHGAGEPLVLLHGGAGGIPMFGPTLPALAQNRRVIAVELQGHGRTPDADRPLSFQAMADDIAALLAQLGVQRADVMGYSLGGGVALQTAIRHPDFVRKLVVMSFPFARRAWFPEIQAAFAQMGPATGEMMRQSPLGQMFPNVDWPGLFTKIGALMRAEYDWSTDVAALTLPTLLVFADADSIEPAHAVEFFRLLGGGLRDAGWDGSGRPTSRLAILPGQTHYDIGVVPTLAGMVSSFLDAPLP